MPKTKDMYAVILAGGSGERFWPMSTSKRPKQFLAIPSGKPLIAEAVARIAPLIPRKQIFIITRADLVELVHRALPDFPKDNIVGEPCGRDTAAAIALGAALVKSRNPAAAFCVLTSDQLIGNHDLFRGTLRESFRLALASNHLITIGIKPTFPSTGFGYIEAGREHGRRKGVSFACVRRFVEKPDARTAAKYFRTGKFYWNSGMFIWSVAALEEAIRKYRPQLAGLIEKVSGALQGRAGLLASAKRFGEAGTVRPRFRKHGAIGDRALPHLDPVLKCAYAKLDKISIDYAVMEKAGNILVAKGNFAWDDVGSWLALENHCSKNQSDNVVRGKVEALEARDNIAVADDGVIALVGVRDLVVVRSGKATLVCARDRVQEIKQLVARMKKSGKYHDVV